MEQQPHEVRTMAESFGVDAARYNRARPAYPEAMIEAVVRASPGREILDVGCGTGIDARQFQAAGCRVLGIDVDERMAAFARARGLTVEIGAFEAWEPAGRTFDALVAGQTWHWVDPVAGAAKAAEVLLPSGRAALFWNVFAPEPDIAAAFADVYRKVTPEWNPWTTPPLEAYGRILTRVVDGLGRSGAFSEPEQWRFDWSRAYTREEWLDVVATGGDMSRFSPTAANDLLTGLGAAVDARGGSFRMGYVTVVVTAVRLDAHP